MNAPIILFAFNRPLLFKHTIETLKHNVDFDQSDIFVFIDGPRNKEDEDLICKVKEIAERLTPNVKVAEENKGLGNSIISGVTEIINQYGKAIVIEDDLNLMPGFLHYMNQGLESYKANKQVFSICGYGLRINKPKSYQGDVYLCPRSSSWGWATWADRWNSIDWNVSDYNMLKRDKKQIRAFNKGGSDMFGMLKDYMEGRNQSWAIRFCYSQFKQGKYSVHPFLSLVDNEGFGDDATNCKQKYSRFKVECNDSVNVLNLPQDLTVNKDILNELKQYHSIPIRIYSKLRNLLDI